MSFTLATILATMLATLLTVPAARAGSPFALLDDYQSLDHTDEQVRSIRVPVTVTLRDWQERPYGLRLRLAGTFATSDLFDFQDAGLAEVSMSSFVPGIEFLIPVGRNHLLLPHVDAGVGFATAVEESKLLAGLGVRSEFIFPGRDFCAGLEPGFRLNTRAASEDDDSLVFSPFMTVSARRMLGFSIDGHVPDAGVFIETGYDFNALELASVRSTHDAVGAQWEAGVGFGFSRSRPRIGPVDFPRIRIGYRFGDIEGWRLRIGGDWLRVLQPF